MNYLDITDAEEAQLERERVFGTEAVADVDREVAARLSREPVMTVSFPTQ